MKWRPDESASEVDPSKAGATRAGGSTFGAERLKSDAQSFVRVGRSLLDDYSDGLLTFDEFAVLMLLWLKANPTDAVFRVSYAAIAEESRGRLSTNGVNKMLLSLKRKHYVYFAHKPGRRGLARVWLNYYPLKKSRSYTDFGAFFSGNSKGEPRSLEDIVAEVSTEASKEVPAEVQAEVRDVSQSSVESKQPVNQGSSPKTPNEAGRGPYNDEIRERKPTNKRSSSVRTKYNPDGPPRTHEDERAREIADALGEPDYRFVLSALAKYGIDVLERARTETEKQCAKGGVASKGALFNTLVRDFGDRKYGDRGATARP